MELGGRKSDGGNSLCNSAEEEERRDDMEKASGSRITYYECSFCKRGFSNAQALGGHMNIHRKDKSKVKPRLPKSKASPPLQLQGYMNTSSPPQIPSSYINSYMCYGSPPLPSSLHTSNPTTQPGLHGGGDPGFDLNLQIGSPSRTHGYGCHHQEIKDADEGDSVDLELRLGRPPPT